jgi:hypothetical protein
MKFSKNQKLYGTIAVLLVIAVIAAAMTGILKFSITPSGGDYPSVIQGASAIWTTALDATTGKLIMSGLECSTQAVPVVVSYNSFLYCKNSAGSFSTVPIADPTSTTTVQCNAWNSGWNGAAVLTGQSSGTVPSGTPVGAGSCYIRVYYTAKYNGNSVGLIDQTGDRSLSVVAAPTPSCSTGQTTCLSSNTVATCNNGAWGSSSTCPVGCSNGKCNQECDFGGLNYIRCVNPEAYQACGTNGFYGVFNYLSNGAFCSNGMLYKHCSDGTDVRLDMNCSTTTPEATQTCPNGAVVPVGSTCPAYCGDGTCNNGETSTSCLNDCPIPANDTVVPPQNGSSNGCPTYSGCAANYTKTVSGTDANGCAKYVCKYNIPQTDYTIWYVGIAALLIVVGAVYFGTKKRKG